MSYYKYIKYKYKYLNYTKNLYGGGMTFLNDSNLETDITTISPTFLKSGNTQTDLATIVEEGRTLIVCKKGINCLVYYTEIDNNESSEIYKIYVGVIDGLKRNGDGKMIYKSLDGSLTGFDKVEEITGKWDKDILCKDKEMIIKDSKGTYNGFINDSGRHGTGHMVYNVNETDRFDIFNGKWKDNIMGSGFGKVNISNAQTYWGQIIGPYSKEDKFKNLTGNGIKENGNINLYISCKEI
jgi:hypothetical protein